MARHKISNVDAGRQEGDCAACGRVSLYWSPSKGRWICRVGKREQRGDKRHGVNFLEAERMKSAASGCEVCGCTDRLVIDHSHETGAIRGVLCHWCNIALGMTRDSPDRLRALASYLER